MVGITALFGSPFRESSVTTALSDIYDCSVNGLPFRLDSDNEAFRQGPRSLPLLRAQADTGSEPGEQSINRDELWRRSSDSWHKGAGQRYKDREDSDPYRYWQSLGICPWEKGQLSLLHEATWTAASSALDQEVLVVGATSYYMAGNQLYKNTDPLSITWTPVTRPAGATTSLFTSMTSDGNKVWLSCADGIQQTIRGAATATAFGTNPGTGAYNQLTYARGRLIGASGHLLYDIDGAGAPGTAINNSFGNTDWRWTTIADSTSHIYAAGFSGTTSQIFRLSPSTTDPTSSLLPPIPAAPPLPTGEIVYRLYSYLGILCIGTTSGVRIATADASGNLTIGSLIPAPPVRCFAGSESFVWFGYSLYEGHSGLGRLDLSVIQETAALTPAYATDLMTDEFVGTVTDVAIYNGKKVFAISGRGLYSEQDTYVESGWITTGRLGYGLIDNKVAERIDVRHEALAGSIEVELSTDSANYVSLGTNDITGTSQPVQAFSAQGTAAEQFDLRLRISRDTSALQTPIIKHLQLRAWPVMERGYVFLAPLLLTENDVETGFSRHPLDDFNALTSLISYNRRINYQELGLSVNPTVEDYDFARHSRTSDGRWWNGTLTLRLKVTQ